LVDQLFVKEGHLLLLVPHVFLLAVVEMRNCVQLLWNLKLVLGGPGFLASSALFGAVFRFHLFARSMCCALNALLISAS
jgi:hypothetical protein